MNAGQEARQVTTLVLVCIGAMLFHPGHVDRVATLSGTAKSTGRSKRKKVWEVEQAGCPSMDGQGPIGLCVRG